MPFILVSGSASREPGLLVSSEGAGMEPSVCTFCSVAWREVYSCHPFDAGTSGYSLQRKITHLEKGASDSRALKPSYSCSLLQTDFPKSSLSSFSKHRVVVPVPGFYHSPQCLWSGSAWGARVPGGWVGAGCPDPRALRHWPPSSMWDSSSS